jgi:phage baseplate assembly protein gpV
MRQEPIVVPAPVVNVPAPIVNVNVEPTPVNVEAPNVNVEAPNVNVESPTVNVAAPAAPDVVVNVETPRTKHRVKRDSNGNIIEVIEEPA